MRLNREITSIATPAIVSNITTPILGLVDTAITGHIGSAAYIGAIAVGGSMFSMLYWVFGFLRMGSSGLTAQAHGAGDSAEARALLWRGLAVAAAVSLLIILSARPLCDVFLRFMEADAATEPLARQYFLIGVWGAPAAIGTYAIAGWLLGMQDSRSPMWMALTTNMVNIAVSLVLVFGFGMKISGVATGTVIAQWAGALLGVAIIARRYKPERPRVGDVFVSERLLRFFKVNADIFLRTLCLVAVTVWFTRIGARQGADVLAVNAVLMQFFLLFSYFIDGFAYAGEAIVGKYYGRRDMVMVRTTVAALMRIAFVLAMICSAVYFLGGNAMISILTDDYGVRSLAADYRMWAVVVPLAGFGAFVFDGVFIGLTYTRAMLVAMALAMAVFFGLLSLLLPIMGNHALWLSFSVYLAVRGVVQWIFFRKVKKIKPI